MITKLSRKDIKMLESSVKNDVSKSALEEYLSAHKKAETAWKVFRDSLVLSESSGGDNDSKEVESEKKRKFKAGDKVRVTSVANNVATTTWLSVGDVVEVIAYKNDLPEDWSFIGRRPVIVTGGRNRYAYFAESALELVVEQGKTPNELRAEIIQRGKEFAEEYADYPPLDSVIQISEQRNKRKIVASVVNIKNIQFTIKEVVVKTHPDDVYNFHIGKAIAIGRLLGKDVTEFENAPQPTIAKGQECIIKNWKGHNGKTLTITKVFDNGKKALHNYQYGYLEDYKLIIIDDTNAQYN